MRTILLCSSLLAFSTGYFVGPTWADEKPTTPAVDERSIEDLIRDLGHLDYKRRESATKALVTLGSKAKPALEKALESEDVEVRMRAGQALRSIGARKNETKAKDRRKSDPKSKRPTTGRRPIHEQSVSIRIETDGATVVIRTRGDDGKFVTKTYHDKTLEAVKKNNPEVQKALGKATARSRSFGNTTSPFREFEKFFDEGWRRPRDENFWKNADSDLNREIDRLRAWARRLADQQRRDSVQGSRGTGGPLRGKLRRQEIGGLQLGVRAHRPEAVLDAQLQLRGRGLVIEEVVRDSDAAKLGLVRFDILLELNGSTVRGHGDVGPALRGRDENAPLSAKVLRRAKIVDLKLTR
jgi:hypothetical protein